MNKNRTNINFLHKLRFSWRKAMPVVMQAESSECAIACLTMICNYYGHNLQLRQLRIAMPASQQGLGLAQVIEYANTLGLSSRALKLDLHDLKNLQTPCILHWDFSHFVVLRKVSKYHVYINDPAIGEVKLSWAMASQHFTGIALELMPKQDFTQSKKDKRLSLWDFAKPIRGIKRHFVILMGLSLFIQVFALASPFYMQTVIDKVLLSKSGSLLMVLAIGFGLLLLIETLTECLRESVILRFSNLFNMHVSSSVLAHLLSLPLAFFQRRHMGDIVSRFSSLQPVRDTLSEGIVSAIIDGLLSVITLVVMCIYSLKLSLIVIAIVLIYSLFRWFLYYPVKQLNQQILQSDAKQQSFFMQSIRAARTIKLSNTSASTHAKWLALFVDNSNQRIRLGQWNISFSIFNKFLFGLENIVIVYVAAGLVMNNQFSIGMLFAFMSYKSRFVGSSAKLIEQWIAYKLLNVHLTRLEDIVYQTPEQSVTTNNELNGLANENMRQIVGSLSEGASIRAENISFSYHAKCDTLFNTLNLHVHSGDFIAIIGTSGCGKTSLLLCLLGLLEPNEGRININGKPLTPSSRKHFNIAAVMQDDQLLNGSVLDNISQFAENVDIPRAINAANLACVDQDIMTMTMQYQTLIGDMGDSLSGGQKQRILLARAIYQEPQLLILDEATSHLDINTEAKVCANLKTLNSTIIMVAHRPQTIATANKIYTLSSHGLTANSYSSDNSQPQPRNKDIQDAK